MNAETSKRESHIQTVLLCIISVLMTVGCAIILGVSDKQNDQAELQRNDSIRIAALQEQVRSLEVRIQLNMDDRYRKSDAREDFAIRDREIAELQTRVLALETKERVQ